MSYPVKPNKPKQYKATAIFPYLLNQSYFYKKITFVYNCIQHGILMENVTILLKA